jgi:hypothetical protein
MFHPSDNIVSSIFKIDPKSKDLLLFWLFLSYFCPFLFLVFLKSFCCCYHLSARFLLPTLCVQHWSGHLKQDIVWCGICLLKKILYVSVLWLFWPYPLLLSPLFALFQSPCSFRTCQVHATRSLPSYTMKNYVHNFPCSLFRCSNDTFLDGFLSLHTLLFCIGLTNHS